MANQIDCDVFVRRNALKNPISYVQGTDLLPIIMHFLDFDIPSGATANVFVLKSDQTAVYGTATINGNDVTIDVDDQMFMSIGLALLQVEIVSNNETLVSFAQPVNVEPNLKSGDFPPSETHVMWIDEAIKQAQEAVSDANQALKDAQTAITGANNAAAAANEAAENAEQDVQEYLQQNPVSEAVNDYMTTHPVEVTPDVTNHVMTFSEGSQTGTVVENDYAAYTHTEDGDYPLRDLGAVRSNQGTESSGKLLGINSEGNVEPVDVPLDQQTILEKSIENYYAMRRTGKVYQTKIWKFATNPTPTGEKLLDNAGLVFEPSTDTVEGQDDYLNGQHPLFEWAHVNYVRDEDGSPRPIAIEGDSNYKNSGAVDVGAMQMSFWWKWDSSNPEYDLITISDMPHPELGLAPWFECVKADGAVLPWCIGSAYVSGIASDGKLRSQPGLKPTRKQSHNNMITNYQAKGSGYWGAGACRNTFQIIFTLIKGATKSTQALFAGVTNYYAQYEASIQSDELHTYFPVTNAQAANIPEGCFVSVGYGWNNNGTANNDRGQATIHAYADDVKVLRKEAMEDGTNTAVYLDIPEESAFNTQPHVYTETFSAPIMISTMHANSGETDSVRGRHDGSPASNTDGKHPYRVQGREYMVGGYIVAADAVAWLNNDGSRDIYVAEKGTAHSSVQNTILDTYKNIGTIPNSSAGTASDWYIGDDGFDESTGSWYPFHEGSGSTQGVCDKYYAGGASSDTLREYLQGGGLGNGLGAGGSFLDLWLGLGGGSWFCLACD